MSYKVIYYRGPSIGLRTRTRNGHLAVRGNSLTISGDDELSIPGGAIRDVELFRLHGLCRMLRIEHDRGTLFVTVVRFCLFNWFALVNSFQTGRLHQELQMLQTA